MEFDSESFDEIAKAIHSDTSPVGIDARKTHVLIIQMLQKLNDRLDSLEKKLDDRKIG